MSCEMAFLRRAQSARCGVKLLERKHSQTLINIMDFEEAVDKLSKANEVRWYGQA